MERLTQRVGNEIYVECRDKVDITEKGIIDLLKTKLAAYEDAEEQGRLVILPEPTPDIDFMRIFNLVMADAEDRVIILPCKVGDTVYSIKKEKCKKRKECREGDVCSEMIANICPDYFGKPIIYETKFSVRNYLNIGETVFLAREEAEKALEGMNNG